MRMYQKALKVLTFTAVLVLGAVAAWGLTGIERQHANDSLDSARNMDGGAPTPDGSTRRPY